MGGKKEMSAIVGIVAFVLGSCFGVGICGLCASASVREELDDLYRKEENEWPS